MLRGAPLTWAPEVTLHWEEKRVDKGRGRFILVAAKENLDYLEEIKWLREKSFLERGNKRENQVELFRGL